MAIIAKARRKPDYDTIYNGKSIKAYKGFITITDNGPDYNVHCDVVRLYRADAIEDARILGREYGHGLKDNKVEG